ncbi:MAG: hypothetical protein GY697_09110 [Desulfobacterales bacterium]|nr:hypothetical protein [Desulfobacterales bacterium]
MIKKKGKAVSFDAMVKFFMQYYDLPTKTDIDKIAERLDRLEMLVREMASGGVAGGRLTGRGRRQKAGKPRLAMTAADTVYAALKTFRTGADLSDIQAKTGFGEKKLRNLIFRLHKLGRIQRQSRGVYRVNPE